MLLTAIVVAGVFRIVRRRTRRSDHCRLHVRTRTTIILHQRPLLDALDNGFCSVEADIFLVDGHLLVAHTESELSPQRSLSELYLDPLRERVTTNGGSVHGDGQRFTLLIDIKSNGESSYRALDELLAEYADVFTHVVDGRVNQRAVTAIVSGNRAVEVIAADSPRYVGIDGRLSDLESDASGAPVAADQRSLGAKFSLARRRRDGRRGPAEAAGACSIKLTPRVDEFASGPLPISHRLGGVERCRRRPDQHRRPGRFESVSADLAQRSGEDFQDLEFGWVIRPGGPQAITQPQISTSRKGGCGCEATAISR